MDKLKESINLSDEIIRNIELSEISIEDIFLKALRFSKLINDTDGEKWLNFEISGYPLNTDGKWLPENFQLADKFTSRKFTVGGQSYYFTETISELVSNYETYKLELPASIDPNISVSSSNPNQYVFPGIGNSQRRILLSDEIRKAKGKITKLKKDIYNYVTLNNYKLKYESTLENIFIGMTKEVSEKLILVDTNISKILDSIYQNLISDNNVDWSNSIHNCRRLLYEVANIVFPADNSEKDIGNGKRIKFSDENYIIRLKEYILKKSTSDTFKNIVGSNLEYIGDKIGAIYNASTKGSHIIISEKREAERYVINTYLLLSDILSL